MVETQRRGSISAHGTRSKKRKRDQLFDAKKKMAGKRLPIGVAIGVFLTLTTIVIQCVAFSTPHWKEISPNTHSLYVDGIDALIRTEILHYFNTIHRSTRQSYGLFQRCEYPLVNSSQLSNQQYFLDRTQKKCTKNYLPSYSDEHFNECHSLPYYRFCTKAGAKRFDVNNDYLRATFDISYSGITTSAEFSCDCHYPPYATACHAIGIIGIIFLIITCLLFSVFSFFTDPHYRLKIKCFGVLASILSMIILMTNLIIIMEHLEYESVEYLIAIERHYKLNQIYKLSQDTKTVIDRFLSSIQIRLGYSGILGWIAFALSIIDGVLLLATCKIKHGYEETETVNKLLASQSDEHSASPKFTPIPNESTPPPPLPALPNFHNERPRIQNEDEV